MDLGLKGATAAVAGASRGLGFAVALELAREGASVAICSRDEAVVKDAAARIIKETDSGAHAIVADVATASGAQTFIEDATSALGGLQVLVTNAGGPPAGRSIDFDDDAWMSAFELNCLSAVRMVRAALSHIQAQPWGRVLMVTSTAPKQPVANLALSNAVRAATHGFAKSLSQELAGTNITVNCLMPGQILTDRLRSLVGAPENAGPDHPAFAEMARLIPAGRIGTTDEFAAVAAFLCSERASFVNGVSLQVDGGYLKGLF